MITGFNTDIEHDGVVYHVQTEDKGLDSPLILSLVYLGGTILASKRSRYEDLIAAGFDEKELTKRLKRQHRLICAAINAGRLEELKRMGGKPGGTDGETAPLDAAFLNVVKPVEKEPKAKAPVAADAPLPYEAGGVTAPLDPTLLYEKRTAPRAPESAYSVYDPRRQAFPGEVITAESGIVLSILDEEEYRAGQTYDIRVLLEDRSTAQGKPLSGVGVSLKVLGTAFRPQIYSVKTERDGVALISVTMPRFITGRAAVLVRVVVKGEPMEARRVIHPAD